MDGVGKVEREEMNLIYNVVYNSEEEISVLQSL